MSLPPGASASIVRVTSVPDGVLRGAERVTVPLVLFPASTDKLVGNTELKPLLLVARMVKFPPVPSVITEKDTVNGFPGIKMLFESA